MYVHMHTHYRQSEDTEYCMTIAAVKEIICTLLEKSVHMWERG